MNRLIFSLIFLIAIGVSKFSSAQDKKTTKILYETYDFASGKKKYYSGIVKYEIKKSAYDGKPYINLIQYSIFGLKDVSSDVSSAYFPNGGAVPINSKTKIGDEVYEYQSTLPYLNGTIYMK